MGSACIFIFGHIWELADKTNQRQLPMTVLASNETHRMYTRSIKMGNEKEKATPLAIK